MDCCDETQTNSNDSKVLEIKEDFNPQPKSFEENFVCCICQYLLYEPTTFPCGHSVCEYHQKDIIDTKKKCPQCRRKLGNLSFHVNKSLALTLQKIYPFSYQKRTVDVTKELNEKRVVELWRASPRFSIIQRVVKLLLTKYKITCTEEIFKALVFFQNKHKTIYPDQQVDREKYVVPFSKEEMHAAIGSMSEARPKKLYVARGFIFGKELLEHCDGNDYHSHVLFLCERKQQIKEEEEHQNVLISSKTKRTPEMDQLFVDVWLQIKKYRLDFMCDDEEEFHPLFYDWYEETERSVKLWCSHDYVFENVIVRSNLTEFIMVVDHLLVNPEQQVSLERMTFLRDTYKKLIISLTQPARTVMNMILSPEDQKKNNRGNEDEDEDDDYDSDDDDNSSDSEVIFGNTLQQQQQHQVIYSSPDSSSSDYRPIINTPSENQTTATSHQNIGAALQALAASTIRERLQSMNASANERESLPSLGSGANLGSNVSNAGANLGSNTVPNVSNAGASVSMNATNRQNELLIAFQDLFANSATATAAATSVSSETQGGGVQRQRSVFQIPPRLSRTFQEARERDPVTMSDIITATFFTSQNRIPSTGDGVPIHPNNFSPRLEQPTDSHRPTGPNELSERPDTARGTNNENQDGDDDDQPLLQSRRMRSRLQRWQPY